MIATTVEDLLQRGSQLSSSESFSEDDPEYQLVADCNTLFADIHNKIVTVHNLIRDTYRSKFPELDSLVRHPIDYARVVKRIGNDTDLTLVDLKGLLPSAAAMVVCVTASTTSGKPLSEENLKRTIGARDRALALDSEKKKLLDLVESRMGRIAPNLSSIVRAEVAAKLMVAAGGLSALANMPSCNLELLGSKKETPVGFSTATSSQFCLGYLEQAEIFQRTPSSLRNRAYKQLASKSAQAATIDSTRGDATGETGRSLLEEIRKKIDSWQELPPAKKPKPLPIPDSKPEKKKRGGRRQREMKERFVDTDTRKLANRTKFGVPETSSLGDGFGEGYGMLGQSGSGKLKVSVCRNKLGIKAAKKFKGKQYGSSGATSGLTSSLAFTHELGMTLPSS